MRDLCKILEQLLRAHIKNQVHAYLSMLKAS
jgi:hypothetical protein